MLLSDLVDEYVTAVKNNTYSPHTVRGRTRVARTFLAQVGNIQVGHITERHVAGYFAARQGSGVQPQSLNLELSILRDLWRFAIRRKAARAGSDPFAERRPFRVIPKPRLRIPPAEFPRLLDAATHPRDRMVVALGLYCLLRQGEITALRIQDVDLANGYIHAVITKSSKIDDMPISEELDGELRRWLTWYTQHVGAPLNPNWYLVPAKTPPRAVGKALLDPDLAALRPATRMTNPERAIHRAMAAAGYDLRADDGSSRREGVHTLRRSSARALFDTLSEQGHDEALRIVQATLHHASVVVTEGYIGVEIDKRKRDGIIKGKKMFPVNRENVIPLKQKEA